MGKILLLWRALLILIFISLLGGALSCVPVEARPRAWIDVPSDGAQVTIGTAIFVISHAYAREGVAEMMLSVNGEPYRREPPSEPGASFTKIAQEWLPEGPGDYLLQVTAYDTKGEVSSPATVWVRVVSEVAPAATETPTPTLTPTSPPAITPTFTPTLAPTFTPTPTPTLIPTPSPTLAPTATPTFTPVPTLTFTPVPPDTTPPSISGITASTDLIKEPTCEPNAVTISAQVSDPSGVSSAEVVYWVVSGMKSGALRTQGMSPAGGSTYQVTLDWNALRASWDPVPTTSGSALNYYIRAQDSRGNTAQSGTNTVAITYCLL